MCDFFPFRELHYGDFTILKVVTREIYQECCLFKIAHPSGVRIRFSHVLEN